MLSTHYKFAECEKKWISLWQENQCFKHFPANEKHPPFSIMIPPPNVTGELHVGHALNQAIQDFLIRYARKRGYSSLWQAGIDHAGIATQTRVERELQKTKKNRLDLGRTKFLQEVWRWKNQSGDIISKQQQRMGFSFEENRKRFTMDPQYSQAVIAAFVALYKKKLIYRAKKIVHWDPTSQTVLSDLEIEHDENFCGKLYSFAYQIKDSKEQIIVATTRPETMLADTAIAVHPQDSRFKKWIGKKVIHPFADREIPIIADSILVDPKFGTGAVKVTPAHDINDFACGERNKLKIINLFDHNAAVNENGGMFAGMDRNVARKAVIVELEKKGLLRNIKNHKISLARSQRTGAVVEPILSMQWFVRMESLAKPALAALRRQEFSIYPKQWETTYKNWLSNIHDWCISRQLWWGHRIPIWYGPDDQMFCGNDVADAKKQAKAYYKKDVPLRQDDDVLDTWFSSALWPFASLGWPDKKKKDLANYYPSSILITAHDIIFFWVARMVMMGMEFMKKVPFYRVYIHGLLRDENGEKMSKTKGNVVDPIQTINTYGTDAFRFFLLATLNEGKDSLYSEQRLKGYYHLTNKIWNSARFLLKHRDDWHIRSFLSDAKIEKQIDELALKKWKMEDGWILYRLSLCIKDIDRSIMNLKFHLTPQRIYEFVWNEYCDWYLEIIKNRIFQSQSVKATKEEKESAVNALQIASYVFDKILDLLHPMMPFISEELAATFRTSTQDKKKPHAGKFVVNRSWPQEFKKIKKLLAKNKQMVLFQEIIRTIRNLRKTLPNTKEINIIIRFSHSEQMSVSKAYLKKLLDENQLAIFRFVRVAQFSFEKSKENEKDISLGAHNSLPFSLGSIRIVQEKNLIDLEDLKRQQKRLAEQMQRVEKKLANSSFLERAPENIVNKEKAKYTEFQFKYKMICQQVEQSAVK